MEIIEREGKKYLQTFIAKIDNNTIDCSPFFVDVEDTINQLVKDFNREHKTHYTFLNDDMYGGNLQAIVNRFSGNYFSASFMKGYEDNPATCFYSMFCDEEVNSATQIGSTIHKILELYYKLPKEKRTTDELLRIKDENLAENQDVDRINKYIQGYIDTKDYLTNEKMNDNQLDCECEVKGREKIYIKDFNLTLPTCAYVIDRIDYRNDDTYIIDYKTGSVTNKNLTFEGNLGQMILYKWAMEYKLDKEIKDVYICAPGNQKYMKVDCGKENQQFMINKIQDFFNKFKQDNSRRVYEFTNKGYFNNSKMIEFREIMNDNSIRFAKIPIEVEIK